ncbi:SWIM zinc finger family protein, partial [Actinoplanes sp. NPDC026623]|uniref:SWIM zinc finger family protein n=1 Tax=Actinoplanes sp. NPDC026623 TaxID=3155610 RepID=UPI0033E8364B
AVAAAAALHPERAWTARRDEAGLAARAGVSAERLRLLLAVLGGQGLVGYDLTEGAWFRRDLPFAAERVAALQPRVRRAAAITAGDLEVNPIPGGHEVFVRGRGFAHRVVLTADDARCTCLWYSRHRGSRGPCRHVLAARSHLTKEAGT